MDKQRGANHSTELEAQILPDMNAEIDLEGMELLKLELGQPSTRVICTAGTLWLTQPGDPQDHLLKAGQSFTPNRRGTVLVQGMPCGTARILPPASLAA